MTKYKSISNGRMTVFDEKGIGYIFNPGQTMDIYGKLIDETAVERVHEPKKEKEQIIKKKDKVVELDDDNKKISEDDE